MEDTMSFHFPTLLYRSALLQREIDAEQRQSKPDWLRVMRLNALRLKLMSRLLAFAPSVTPGNAALPA
jgi:hypothetical protein